MIAAATMNPRGTNRNRSYRVLCCTATIRKAMKDAVLAAISSSARRFHPVRTTPAANHKYRARLTSVDKYVSLYNGGVEWNTLCMKLSEQDRAELHAALRAEGYDGSVSSRAQMANIHPDCSM